VIHRSLTTGDVDERSSTSPKKKFGVASSTQPSKKKKLFWCMGLPLLLDPGDDPLDPGFQTPFKRASFNLFITLFK